MAKTKTRGRVTAAKPAKAPHARRAKSAKPACATRRRAAQVTLSQALQHTMQHTLERATQRFERRKRQLASRAARQIATLQRTARQTQRTMRQGAQRRIALIQRSLRQSQQRTLRQITTTRRAMRQRLQRTAREMQRAVQLAPARMLEAANYKMRQMVEPVMLRAAAANRMAVAGATAAVAVTIISIGWLALFDQATAVPNREAGRAGQSMNAWQRDAVRDAEPMLGNIEPAKVYPQSRQAIERDLDATAAPVKKQSAAPVKAERPLSRQEKRRAARQRNWERVYRARASVSSSDTLPAFGGGGNTLIAEARRYLGTNPTGRNSLWCAAFLDMVLKRTGHQGGGNLALGYAHYGTRVAGPEVGAIAVMGRRGGGHVGVVSGIDANGNPIIVSGNHNHIVAEAVYPRGRIITYVLPN
jgi:uncharacterized protein (TIGR02594 family)